MGNYLNPGNDMFYKMVHSEIYVDKTGLIGYCNHVINTMQRYICVSRPRRFGKTLNMDMLKCFFSNQYRDQGQLFEGLNIWKEEKYQQLQGTYPVIYLSFADVKQTNYKDAVLKIKKIITDVYQQ